MIEVEIKARIADEEEMRQKLEEQKAIKLNTVKQIDRIYIKKEVKGFQVSKGDPVIRIRKENDRVFFTLKKKSKDTMSNVELETVIDKENIWNQILLEMGYKEVVCVKKQRTIYVIEDFKVCIDTVEDLGNFIEIELIVEQEEQELEARKKIEEFFSILKIEEKDIVKEKYDTLVYEKRKNKMKD